MRLLKRQKAILHHARYERTAEIKRSPTFDVTEGLKQNTRNSVIGLERLKFTLMK